MTATNWLVPPRVATHGCAYNSLFYNMFFVFGLVDEPGLLVGEQVRYLHPDGTWHKTVTNAQGEFVGYYDTLGEAQALLDRTMAIKEAA